MSPMPRPTPGDKPMAEEQQGAAPDKHATQAPQPHTSKKKHTIPFSLTAGSERAHNRGPRRSGELRQQWGIGKGAAHDQPGSPDPSAPPSAALGLGRGGLHNPHGHSHDLAELRGMVRMRQYLSTKGQPLKLFTTDSESDGPGGHAPHPAHLHPHPHGMLHEVVVAPAELQPVAHLGHLEQHPPEGHGPDTTRANLPLYRMPSRAASRVQHPHHDAYGAYGGEGTGSAYDSALSAASTGSSGSGSDSECYVAAKGSPAPAPAPTPPAAPSPPASATMARSFTSRRRSSASMHALMTGAAAVGTAGGGAAGGSCADPALAREELAASSVSPLRPLTSASLRRRSSTSHPSPPTTMVLVAVPGAPSCYPGPAAQHPAAAASSQESPTGPGGLHGTHSSHRLMQTPLPPSPHSAAANRAQSPHPHPHPHPHSSPHHQRFQGLAAPHGRCASPPCPAPHNPSLDSPPAAGTHDPLSPSLPHALAQPHGPRGARASADGEQLAPTFVPGLERYYTGYTISSHALAMSRQLTARDMVRAAHRVEVVEVVEQPRLVGGVLHHAYGGGAGGPHCLGASGAEGGECEGAWERSSRTTPHSAAVAAAALGGPLGAAAAWGAAPGGRRNAHRRRSLVEPAGGWGFLNAPYGPPVEAAGLRGPSEPVPVPAPVQVPLQGQGGGRDLGFSELQAGVGGGMAWQGGGEQVGDAGQALAHAGSTAGSTWGGHGARAPCADGVAAEGSRGPVSAPSAWVQPPSPSPHMAQAQASPHGSSCRERVGCDGSSPSPARGQMAGHGQPHGQPQGTEQQLLHEDGHEREAQQPARSQPAQGWPPEARHEADGVLHSSEVTERVRAAATAARAALAFSSLRSLARSSATNVTFAPPGDAETDAGSASRDDAGGSRADGAGLGGGVGMPGSVNASGGSSGGAQGAPDETSDDEVDRGSEPAAGAPRLRFAEWQVAQQRMAASGAVGATGYELCHSRSIGRYRQRLDLPLATDLLPKKAASLQDAVPAGEQAEGGASVSDEGSDSSSEEEEQEEQEDEQQGGSAAPLAAPVQAARPRLRRPASPQPARPVTEVANGAEAGHGAVQRLGSYARLPVLLPTPPVAPPPDAGAKGSGERLVGPSSGSFVRGRVRRGSAVVPGETMDAWLARGAALGAEFHGNWAGGV